VVAAGALADRSDCLAAVAQEAGLVLAQVGAELVVHCSAVSDGVLLGAGQDRDGLGQLGIGGSGRW
jgi:hypothetical protein